MDTFKGICKEIGMPIAQDKSAGPAQIIQFPGLMIDTKDMVIRIPQDKKEDLRMSITKTLSKKKATSLQLQSLAGKLNFVCKAVPGGRPFIVNIYRSFAGIPQHHHIQLTGEVLTDLRMWQVFLSTFWGWQSIISNKQREENALELYTDTAGNPSLGWGAYLPLHGLWKYQQWDSQ